MESPSGDRAELLLELKRPHEAIDIASRAVATEPSNPHLWLVLARAFLMVNRPVDALGTANRALGLDPNAPEPHLIASHALRQLHNTEQSIVAAYNAVQLAPMLPTTHANLAVALTGRGTGQSTFGHFLPRHLRAAAQHATHAIELRPDGAEGHFAAGYVAMKSGQQRRARAHYRRALAIDPQHYASINNLAVIDLGRGRLSRGGAGFARAVATDPSNGLARKNVRAVIDTTLFVFHALGWLIYSTFSAEAGPTGASHFAWSKRTEVACVLAAVYALLGSVTYLRMERRVRAFARRMLADSVLRKAVLAVDAATAVCFLASAAGTGADASAIYQWGFLGVLLSLVGLMAARSSH